MIKYDKRCKPCQIIQLEGGVKSPLLNRIYNSRQFVPDGEALTEILADYESELKYLSLYKHSRNHQSLTEDETNALVIKAMEKRVQHEKLTQLTTTQFRNKLKEKAAQKLDNDQVKGWTVASIAKVLKDEDDVVAKQKDQQIKILGMIESFQSGVVKLPAHSGPVIEVTDYAVLPEEPI